MHKGSRVDNIENLKKILLRLNQNILSPSPLQFFPTFPTFIQCIITDHLWEPESRDINVKRIT